MIAPVNSKGYEEFEFSITFTIYLSIICSRGYDYYDPVP